MHASPQSDSRSLRERFGAATAEDDAAPFRPIHGAPGTRPRLLLMSLDMISRRRDARAKLVTELDHMACTDPDRLVAWLDDETRIPLLMSASAVAQSLARKPAVPPIEHPRTPPAAGDVPAIRNPQPAAADEAPVENDDTATPGMDL